MCTRNDILINLFIIICRQYLPGKAQAQIKVAKNRAEMFEFYQSLIDEHRETLDISSARDLIDVYLIEIEKAKLEGRAGELFEGRDHGKLKTPLVQTRKNSFYILKLLLFVLFVT